MATWQVRNNHGGGYAYRLCPADSPLTEACFQSHPLDFVRNQQALVLGNGSMVPIKGTFLDVGTSPEGSTWAMMPTVLGPRCVCSPDLHYKPANYDCGCLKGEEKDSCTSPGNCSSGECLPCPGTPGSDCSRCGNVGKPQFPDQCPGGACRGWPGPAIRDVVKVPADLAPGEYVLGFRYVSRARPQCRRPTLLPWQCRGGGGSRWMGVTCSVRVRGCALPPTPRAFACLFAF